MTTTPPPVDPARRDWITSFLARRPTAPDPQLMREPDRLGEHLALKEPWRYGR